jgi:para-aminobenzoate synthetase/4-amino-4-deoxychorismate lyase
MKGTIRRGLDIQEDAVLADALQLDEKNRSENLMIVDLLRNDLGRICEFGSVSVEELFSIERYETLFQMTSTVCGKLLEGVDYEEIFRSLFPCGSITGAPKLRTMQIIRELESGPRGVYTGAIGFFSPDKEAMFNVAIRTICLRGAEAEMGVGGGIVYDSAAEQEYRECLLKGSFLISRLPPFQLIETMLWSSEYERLALHLKRLKASAEYFSFSYQEDKVMRELFEHAAKFTLEKSYRVRLLLEKSGKIQITSSQIEREERPWRVAISSARTSSTDRFLRHKTTNRSLYEAKRQSAIELGFDDLLFLNERDEVTEGAITNLFAEIGDKLCTPPVSCGLLPGVYREYLLQSDPRTEERVLLLSDLKVAKAVYLSNSVRGLRKAQIHFDAVI